LTAHSADVRRHACDHLQKHGGPDQTAALIELLGDSDSGVVKSAVRAIGRCGATEDAAALKPLLAASDGEIRVEAAAALAELGSSKGPAALERLALHEEPRVRRSAAVAMGRLGDSVYLPRLIELLEDETSVQRAALRALPQVVGRDIAADQATPPASLRESIELWQDWYRERGHMLQDADAR
jgi:HEAT repeat protein